MQPYYVFFVTAYDSENREMGQYLGAVGIEIVQAHPNHHAALDEARRLVPWKPQFVIQRVVQKVPDLEEQRSPPVLRADAHAELTKDIPRDVLNGRIMAALSEPME